MDNWRNEVIWQFEGGHGSFFIVNDPDFLLNDEHIVSFFEDKNIHVLRFDDSISIRYLFESQYKELLENHKASLLLYTNDEERDVFPFDFLQKGQHIRLSINNIFPEFSPVIVKQLNQETLDSLYVLKSGYRGSISDRDTLEFILRYVYKIPYELIDSKVELYKPLLSIHDEKKEIPEVVQNYLIAQLLSHSDFNELPIAQLIRSSQFFYQYYGVETAELNEEKIFLLHKKLKEQVMNASSYKDWISIADLSAEYKNAVQMLKEDIPEQEANQIFCEINQKFEEWVLHHYYTLTSLPPFPKPKMVHHIVHNLASLHNEKIALIVMDGMSFIQWKAIRKYLTKESFQFEETGIFAWVPTLTSVSRQAIFSGHIPVMFGNYLKTTAKEETHWKKFWEDHGVLKQYVQFQKGLGKEPYNKATINAFKRPNVKIFGCVIDMIDHFVHGASQGEKSIMAELEIWLETGYLLNLLNDLKKSKYTIYLTADHGNTECVGVGRILEGVLADQKGERVRVYHDEVIYRDSAERIESISWNGVGLPENYHVLLAKYGQAFVAKNQRIVSHGSISLEEVVVPFIKVITD